MNDWTKLSVEFANQRNYLDELYKVYPISPNLRREIPKSIEDKIKKAFKEKNNIDLLNNLLSLDLFPIKDSYVAFLKKDRNAILRNPQTVNRIAGNLYHMGISEIIEKCSQPKETNRQIGPMFKRWVDKGSIGVNVFTTAKDFLEYNDNCIYNASDAQMKNFAIDHLGFSREKGIDFLAKFNGKYVIAETKFITDFGGHQNGQFDDAVSTMQTDFSKKSVPNEVVPISIMDGVLYLECNSKMFRFLKDNPQKIILSALLLREFLFSL